MDRNRPPGLPIGVAGSSPADAVVVGSGPNGLVAAITLARHGLRVVMFEAADEIGGALRSGALTRPGFVHDLGSAVHPLGVGSPVMRALPLARFGVRWVHPPVPMAHPLDDRPAARLERGIAASGESLGRDARRWQQLMAPLVRNWQPIVGDLLGPLRVPRHPLASVAFGLRALWPATVLGRTWFADEPARALLAGLCAHACLPLEAVPSAAFGLMLGMLGHAVGWPMPAGGAGSLARALGALLQSLGGMIVTGRMITSLDELPRARLTLLDLSPRGLMQVAGDRLAPGERAALQRFRHASGILKVDWALADGIPWRDPACHRAGTLHLGGSAAAIARSERLTDAGAHSDDPYVLLAQPSRFDPHRAPPGYHTAWAYGHVPFGDDTDRAAAIEAQIERFAPGFRERIIDRAIHTPSSLTALNANLVGGDITGGRTDLLQLFRRPTRLLRPYHTSVPGVYLCSASTPPGPGVHGLCGYHAAQAALRDLAARRIR